MLDFGQEEEVVLIVDASEVGGGKLEHRFEARWDPLSYRLRIGAVRGCRGRNYFDQHIPCPSRSLRWL